MAGECIARLESKGIASEGAMNEKATSGGSMSQRALGEGAVSEFGAWNEMYKLNSPNSRKGCQNYSPSKTTPSACTQKWHTLYGELYAWLKQVPTLMVQLMC